MHYIQKNIISTLASHSPLRFSQLQPCGVPNNSFAYHLKKLIQSGYVIMTDAGYINTRKALKTLHYDSGRAKRAVVPALITMVYVTDQAGRLLLLRRRDQPFADWYGIPSGLMHQKETLQCAASRELFEKTGISPCVPLVFAGVLDFRYLEKDSKDLFIHAVSFVYTYRYTGCPLLLLQTESKFGELFWSDLTDDQILPEVYAVDSLVEDGKHAVHSVDFDEPALICYE